MDRLKKAYYSSLTSAICQMATIMCGLIIPRLILSHYGSAYNGVISSITQFLGFFSILQAGLQGATRVALYKPLADNDHQKISSIMKANQRYYRQISIALIGYIIFLSFLFPFLITEGVSKKDVLLFVLIIGASNFVQYFFGNPYKALLSANQLSYILNILQTATIILNTAICAFIICGGGSAVFAKFGSALVCSLNPIVLYLYVLKKYKFDKTVKADKSALKGRWDVLANSFANIIHENVDMLCITIFCSPFEVSVYAVYNLISSGLTRLTFIFSTGVEAAYGNMLAKKEYETLNKNFVEYEHLVFSISAVMTSCILTLAIPFVREYTRNVTDVNYIRPLFAVLLSIAFATMCIRIPYITMVMAAGHYKETKVGSFVEAGINLISTVILVQVIGIEGAIIGTIIANTFRSIQYGCYSSKKIINRPFKIFFHRIIWLVFTISINVPLSLFVNRINVSGWIGWLLKGFLCLGVCVIVVTLSSIIFYRKDFESVICHIKKTLFKR